MKSKQNFAINKRLNLMNAFVSEINKCETKQQVYENLTRQLPILITADHASVSIVDNAFKNLDRLALFGKKVFPSKGQTIEINKTSDGFSLLKKGTFVINHPNAKCANCSARTDCESFRKLGHVTGMSTPLYIKGQAIGTINVASYTKNVYTKNVRKLFETIALLVSACLEKIHFIKSIGSSQNRISIHAQRLKLLTNVSLNLAHATSEKNLLQIVCDCFAVDISAEKLNYILVDRKSQQFTMTHSLFGKKLMPINKTFPMGESILTKVLETGKPQSYNDFGDIEANEMRKQGINHAWSIPIFKNNEVFRLLNLGMTKEPLFKEDLLDIFTILGSLIGTALEGIRANKDISYRAKYDLLTGVHNRHSFQEKITGLIDKKPTKPFSLLIIDLDKFKQLNDFHGHLFGDKVLTKAVKHFQTIFGKKSFVARLGGDEFAVIGDFSSPTSNPLNKIDLKSLTIKDGKRSVPVGFSVGVAHFPRQAQSKSKLMRNADLALYAAKTSPSKIKVFNRAMASQYTQTFYVLHDFKDALLKKNIIPFYQPIIDLKTHKLHALEALVRWDHKNHGILSPADFSAVFEAPELCGQIAYVLHRRICKDMAQWKKNGINFNQVGLNVEPVNLMDAAFPLHLIGELHKNGLKPKDFAIEITENFVLNSQNKHLFKTLNGLRLAGMSIVLDDYGTGFSSISHLQELPVTTIKLDKSYVSKSLNNEKAFHIVSSIISLMKKLNIKTVAEGIETKNTKKQFTEWGCDYGQGFLFSKPLPAHKIPAFIDKLNNDKCRIIAA